MTGEAAMGRVVIAPVRRAANLGLLRRTFLQRLSTTRLR